ncbi:MAG TPA: cytochrome c3 family protein [Ramlibacter sp.]|nr:cytochrome c3 family protein [Ramlibacter sp.]
MTRFLLPLLCLLVVVPARAAIPAESEDCLGCHEDPDQTFDLPSGEKLPLYVDKEVFTKSVHGQNNKCTDCHVGKTSDHATGELPFKTRHEASRAYFENCKGCHLDQYTKLLDGIHYAKIAAGSQKVPACGECHGAHDIVSAKESRTKVAAKCMTCHPSQAAAYKQSVHGRAVDTNQDVPVCTDCHRPHEADDPRDGGALSLRTAQMCGRCHSDATLMGKYGVSPNVVKTYLADFHGMAAQLSQGQKKGPAQRIVAGCTDCHGIHDIQKADDPSSAVVQANLQKTCARCHEGATATFPAAWLSHYEPSPEKAPVVWVVVLFYKFMIPFMVGELSLQIALHLWRTVVNR